MKLSQLNNPVFQGTMKKLMGEPLPLKVAFKLKGISQKIDGEVQKYDEVRLAALKRFGNKKADGSLDTNEDGSVKLERDNLKQFATELQELLDSEVEVGSVRVDELGELIKLSVNELIVLDGVIT